MGGEGVPPVPERGHGVTLGSSDADGEGAIDLDRLTAEEDVGDVTDVSSPDSHGNTMVFNKLELDVFKGDKKHKKAPYVCGTSALCAACAGRA